LKIIYSFNQKHPELSSSDNHEIKYSIQQIIGRYAFFASIIIGAALFLPHFAEKIAQATGLGSSFVGTLFLAASTSLPEIAVSIAAVKMGSVDLAVGNLLGSNLFNVFILFLDDVFYTKGHLLKDASPSHLISVFSVVIMSAVVIIGLTYHAKNKRYLLAWDTLLILIIYIINIGLLYNNQ
jgi:cation:H+ antiporter